MKIISGGGISQKVEVGPHSFECVVIKQPFNSGNFYTTASNTFWSDGAASYEYQVKDDGQKTEIQEGCNYWLLKGGDDYYFLIENRNSDNTLNATFTWNDGFTDAYDPSITEWTFSLNPGQTQRRKLIGSGGACILNQESSLEECPDSPEEFADIIRKTGSHSKVYMEGVKRPYDVDVYSGVWNKKYWFVIDNNSNYTYHATYQFELTNLAIDGPDADADNKFTVNVQPGGIAIKSLTPIDPNAPTQVNYNFGFNLIKEQPQ